MTTRYRDNCAPPGDPRIVRIDDVRPAGLRAWAAACHFMHEAGVSPVPPDYVVRGLKRRGWWPR